MDFQDHLIELFEFNDKINRKLFRKIGSLNDQTECIMWASHLINCQYKWMARLTDQEIVDSLSWWKPIYSLGQLEEKWEKSLLPWIELIKSLSPEDLETERHYVGSDGEKWAAKPKDIALQLNFHSVHHRAQIQTIIRSQGEKPDFVDYIGTKARKLS